MPTKQELRALLLQGPVQVTFTKIDGTERTMVCTLNESFLPVRPAEPSASKPKPEHIIPVWSIVDQGWRSIRVDSVQRAVAVELNG